MADHLSRLEIDGKQGKNEEIDDAFPEKHILTVSHNLIPWFADFANYLASNITPERLTFNQKKFMYDVQKYYWDDPYLFRVCTDGLIRRCVSEVEMVPILKACHSSPVGDHYGSVRTAAKVLQCGFYSPTLHHDAHEFVKQWGALSSQRISGSSLAWGS